MLAKGETFFSTNSQATVIFRATDSSNYWAFVLTPTIGQSGLVKVVAGVGTQVATGGAALSAGTPYLLSVIASGNSIWCQVNGVTVLSTSDSFNSSATKHGLQAYNGIVTFDDFSVTTP